MKAIVAIAACFALAACTSTSEIKRPGGVTEYSVVCGAATPWSVCYNQANKQCPSGYTTVSEKAGLNRKEMRFACPRP